MKTPDQNKKIKEAFRTLEENKFASFFIVSLQKQFKRAKGLTEKQQKVLFEIVDNLSPKIY